MKIKWGNAMPHRLIQQGGHFNPTNSEHGFHTERCPHLGDLENIEVKKDGSLKVELLGKLLSFRKGKCALLTRGGKALVIHEWIDDYKSQPSGDAGERLACAEIKSAEEILN